MHEVSEQLGDPSHAHPRLGGTLGEAVARQRRHDDVERVGRVAAEAPWVAEQRDDLEHLQECAGPAVQQQRRGIGAAAALVHEVQAQPVDLGAELRELVDRPLLLAPVEAVAPVGAQLAQVVQVAAVVPISFSTRLTSARTLCSEATSSAIGVTCPSPTSSSAAARALAWSRAVTITCMPRWASCRATSSPIP